VHWWVCAGDVMCRGGNTLACRLTVTAIRP
jgi:hypothetical protein